MLVAAGVAAAAGIGYTLLTGAQVPTVRSCVAAVLILAGIALGRDAISIRLIAAGALVVLLFRPEALAGPSFQMSFAAVTAIVALHSTAWSRAAVPAPRGRECRRGSRARCSAMIATGLVVELALMPMALFHFHRAGLYGVGANIVAIPLTTFVIMPLEAGALLLDLVGWGKPLWFLCGAAIDGLLGLAHAVASAKGAVAFLPSMPAWAFGLMVAGGLWLCLWNTRLAAARDWCRSRSARSARRWPRRPILLVTGDGASRRGRRRRHAAYPARPRRRLCARACSPKHPASTAIPAISTRGRSAPARSDACVALLRKGSGEWRVLATRSRDADRLGRDHARLRRCRHRRFGPPAAARLRPRWLKLDRYALAATGGVAIYLGAIRGSTPSPTASARTRGRNSPR